MYLYLIPENSHLLKSHAVSVLPLVAEKCLVHLMCHFQGVNTQDLHEHWVDCMVQPMYNEFDATFTYTTDVQPVHLIKQLQALTSILGLHCCLRTSKPAAHCFLPSLLPKNEGAFE